MRARQHGDGRRRHRAEQQHVHADRGEAGDQRVLDHVAGQARVLADDDAVAVLAALEPSPAACPTFSARSGVITPLARPRMPSVPKYLRTMMAGPARGRSLSRPPTRMAGPQTCHIRNSYPLGWLQKM